MRLAAYSGSGIVEMNRNKTSSVFGIAATRTKMDKSWGCRWEMFTRLSRENLGNGQEGERHDVL